MKDLILISHKAHQKYISNQIKSSTNQFYYNDMMNYLYWVITNIEQFHTPLAILEGAFNKLKEVPLSFNNELKYKKLAIAHTNEIVLCILQRFNGKLYDKN